jgi:hypothetical protein
MKDYLQMYFPEKMSYKALRAAILEAWDAMSDSFLIELVNSMEARCKAVRDAQGMYTKY